MEFDKVIIFKEQLLAKQLYLKSLINQNEQKIDISVNDEAEVIPEEPQSCDIRENIISSIEVKEKVNQHPKKLKRKKKNQTNPLDEFSE